MTLIAIVAIASCAPVHDQATAESTDDLTRTFKKKKPHHGLFGGGLGGGFGGHGIGGYPGGYPAAYGYG